MDVAQNSPTRAGGGELTLRDRDVDPFREMLRQQLLGDQELLRDCVAGREDPEIRLQVYDRIRLVRHLADEVGLPEKQVERRQGPRRGRSARNTYAQRSLRVPLPAVWATLGILLSGMVVYTAGRLTGDSIPSVFLPVIAWITLRYGRKVGVLGTLACAAVYAGLDPFLMDRQSVYAGVIAFASFLLGNWLIRHDLF